MGEKLNCEVINTARSGYGNDAIYHQTLKAIMNNKVDHVFVMWSEWTRQDFLLDTLNDTEYVNIPTWNIDKESTISNEVINNWYNDTFNKNFPKKHKSNPRHINVAPIPSMKQLVNTNINYIYSLEVICEKLNIELSQLTSKVDIILENTLSEILDDKLFEDLDILGPEVKDLVGTNPNIGKAIVRLGDILKKKVL